MSEAAFSEYDRRLSPTAIAFDKTGALWSTQKALVPNGAQVVKVKEARRKWWKHPRHLEFKD